MLKIEVTSDGRILCAMQGDTLSLTAELTAATLTIYQEMERHRPGDGDFFLSCFKRLLADPELTEKELGKLNFSAYIAPCGG